VTHSIDLAAALDALVPKGTHSKKPLTQFNLHKCVNMAAEFHTRGGTQFFLSIHPLLCCLLFFFCFLVNMRHLGKVRMHVKERVTAQVLYVEMLAR